MSKNQREDRVTQHTWETFVAACKKHPMNINLQDVQRLLDGLNEKTAQTTYGFDLQQVVDGVIPPNVADLYHDGEQWTQPIKAERTGSVVQAVLDKLPQSVRSGRDDNYEVYQIRLDDLKSWEHLMGTTTLLMFFLNIRPEGGLCYLLPDDSLSVQNWDNLQQMHAEYFPQLPPEGQPL